MDSLALLGRALSERSYWHSTVSALLEALKSDFHLPVGQGVPLAYRLFMCPPSGILAGLQWLKEARGPLSRSLIDRLTEQGSKGLCFSPR